MSLIKILPEELANQIAAGEVVERPASVVKEFVENCVDAGARQITVEVEGGGTRLLRVIDDGQGMDQDDVLLCLERHATSKLRELADLTSISTMGFRGEAVPAIASVCRLSITSRQQGHELGCRAEVRYGQVRKIHEIGCPQGTVMEVRDLFGNVPARKKFLKSTRTELLHVEEAVLGAALAHPAIAWRYVVAGREVFSFPPQDDPVHRVNFVLKRRSVTPLVAVQSCESVADGAVAVRGWLLPPDEIAPASARLRLFVADRPVRDRMVSHAVSEGMHGFLGKGKRPVGVLFVDLPPEVVDVNVHPAKQEIRFRNAQLIHQLVSQAVRQAMGAYQHAVKFSLFTAQESSEPVSGSKSAEISVPPLALASQEPPSLFVDRSPRLPSVAKGPMVAVGAGQKMAAGAGAIKQNRLESSPPSTIRNPESERIATRRSADGYGVPRYLGQVANSYILCESSQGLLVIDQHAAHERLLYERLRRHYLEHRLASQNLLFPEMVECSPAQLEVLERYHDEIAMFGLDIQPFGGETWTIKAIPVLLSALAPLDIFHGIMSHYLAGEVSGTRVEELLATMACKAAIKAHDSLTQESGEALMAQMVAADIFSHCPHGRPVIRLFSPQEMGRWFKRT